jgi:methylenetetrahydrofolate dehydrogenase (NADP+)/methenyltetrahydrofolate cyclohydrolase
MILDGTSIASAIQDRLTKAIKNHTQRPPGLAFVLVGQNPASRTYTQMKKKRCMEVGIFSIDKEFSETISEKKLIEEIETLNRDPLVDGILVQLPLPAHLSVSKVITTISPQKDVDGFHPYNVGKMLLGERDGFLPCTPLGIQVMLAHAGIQVEGKHVVIVGRSNIVGKPLAALLMQKAPHANATVTVAHASSQHLSQICKTAAILVAAIGKPRFITKEMIKQGAVVIDVGINRSPDSSSKHLIGDVDFEQAAPLCSWITPVPGGVGPMTIAMLLANTLLSYQRRHNLPSHPLIADDLF